MVSSTSANIHLQVVSVKLPPPSFLPSTKKVTALISSQVRRVGRALSRAKSTLLHFLKKNFPLQNYKKHRQKYDRNKLFFGSFRLHYNWCSSSPVVPVASSCYVSTWNNSSVFQMEKHSCEYVADNSQLSEYLRWLEEKKFGAGVGDGDVDCEDETNDIDQLAEIFIARCHEKFILEKVESERKFQEMLARGL